MGATRKLAIYLKPYWLWAVLAPLFMVLEVAMDLMQPRLVQVIIDQGVAQSNMNTVLSTGLLMLALTLIGAVGGLGCGIFAVMAGQSFGADVRGALFRKVQALSFGNLDHLETGKLITRLTNDVTQIQEMVMMLLRVMVRAPLLLVGSLIMAFLTSPQLAWLFIVLMPIVLVVVIFIIKLTYPMFSRVQRELDALNTVMQENLAGVRVVKAFARAAHEIGRFRQTNNRLMARNTTAVRLGAGTMPVMMLVLNGGVVAALWIGGINIKAGGMEVGQLIAFINYLMQALMSLMMVSMLVVRFARAAASAQRIEEVLESTPQIQPAAEPLPLPAPRGRVAFENVSFSYNGDDRDPVLKQINLVAEPGQTIALLGATGSGKSSLVNLIPRFYDVTGGRVTIDGIDVREIDEGALRSAIGAALQESILFSGTIRDNIRYGKPDATDGEVIAAAKMAQAHDFISSFPDGYDTEIGQRGVNLSGGQKQRIAIARALLPQPSILILDDSTSAVDVETEARIQNALSGLPQTRFIVAQRISTVLTADTILILDDGQVVDSGTHGELLVTSPIYREIYASQMENGAVVHA